MYRIDKDFSGYPIAEGEEFYRINIYNKPEIHVSIDDIPNEQTKNSDTIFSIAKRNLLREEILVGDTIAFCVSLTIKTGEVIRIRDSQYIANVDYVLFPVKVEEAVKLKDGKKSTIKFIKENEDV